MKKHLIILASLLLTGCDLLTPLNSNKHQEINVSSILNNSTSSLNLEDYGDFQISGVIKNTTTSANYKIENNICYLLDSLGEYNIKGYFQGKFVIPENVLSVTLIFEGAAIYSNNSSNIEYLGIQKAIEVKSKKDTINYIVNDSANPLIKSANNVKFTGGGSNLLISNASGSIVEGKDVTFKNSSLYFKTQGVAINCSDIALTYGIDAITNEVEKSPTLEVINASTVFKVKNNFYGFMGDINVYNASELFNIGLDLYLGESGLWDDKNYDGQSLNITYPSSCTLYNVKGNSYINNSKVIISEK